MDTEHLISRREFAKLAGALVLAPGYRFVHGSIRSESAASPTSRWPGYENAVVIDSLASPGPFNIPNRTGHPLSGEMLANAKASGITAVNVTVSGGGPGHTSFDSTFKQLGYWERELTEHPDVLVKVQSLKDLELAKQSKRLGLIYGFQDAAMLEADLERVELFHQFGVKIIQLTYNLRNQVGDGCLEPGNAGLSKFGNAVVERMNELGIVVDVSHCSQRTTATAIEASSAPVAITHSGCQAVFDHPRSKRDEELRRMAEKGGVIGIYMMPFLNAEGPAMAEHLMQHIEYAVNLCGEDHVGIGSDNSITPTVDDAGYRQMLREFAVERQRLQIAAPRENELLYIPDLNDPRRMEMIADHLLARGHSEARVEKIIGGNWVRLFREVWK
jgi:membrane dipeptidase